MEHFSLDKEVQLKILALLIQDYDFAHLCFDIVRPEYFESKVHSWVFIKASSYFKKFNSTPTYLVLINEVTKAIQNGVIPSVDVEAYTDTFSSMKSVTNLSDTDYIRKEIISFCKRKAFKQQILEFADEIHNKDHDDVFWSKVETNLRDTFTIGNSTLDLGIQYFDDYVERIDRRNQGDSRPIYGTHIYELDSLIGGGIKAGQLGVWIAGSGRGKSIALVHCGKTAVLNNKTVVHYTLELDQEEIASRYDANLARVPIHKLEDNTKIIKDKLASCSTKYGNRLLIKSYPTMSASVNTIRAHLAQLKSHDIVPDMVIVDYGDLLKPETNYNDQYQEVGKIFENLRGLAGELKVPVWTATQINRSGYSADSISMEHMSDSMKKVFIADLLIGIVRDRDASINEEAKLVLVKNRNGPDSREIDICTNYERMCFFDPLATKSKVAKPEVDDTVKGGKKD